MKRVVTHACAGLIVGAMMLMNSGCDWSTGGGVNSFNTSQGAGININFSGFYRGELAGGKAVANTSAGSITSFNIAQVGNSLTVVDNQGSTYTGSVGSPGIVSRPVNGVYPNGAELVQSQVNWTGVDNASGKEVNFVGTIHVITVIDLQQDIDNSTTTSTGGNSSSTTTTILDNNTTEVVIIEVDGDQTTTTTILKKTDTGEIISSSTEVTTTSTTSDLNSYSITEANSQYRLEGIWIETDGRTSAAQSISAGSAGLIVVESATTPTLPVTP